MMELDILKELPIQNVDIQEDGKEEEKTLEVMDSLALPSKVADVTPTTEKTEMMEEMEQEDTTDENEVEELMDQELALQKEEEEYSIYVAGISEEEESDTETYSEESPSFF